MENHNSTVLTFVFQGPTQLDPLRNLTYWFGDSSGCSGGTSGLSRVKLQDEERDTRSPWTMFLLPSKLIAADKRPHKAAVHGACRPEPALVTALTSRHRCMCGHSCTLRDTEKSLLVSVWGENLTTSKAKEDYGGYSLYWILSNHLHFPFIDVL